jgi:hypothetical protein
MSMSKPVFVFDIRYLKDSLSHDENVHAAMQLRCHTHSVVSFTNYMEQNTSCEANTHSVGQEISCFLWQLNVH